MHVVMGTETATFAFVQISQPFGSEGYHPENKLEITNTRIQSFRVVLAKLNIQSYHAF